LQATTSPKTLTAVKVFMFVGLNTLLVSSRLYCKLRHAAKQPIAQLLFPSTHNAAARVILIGHAVIHDCWHEATECTALIRMPPQVAMLFVYPRFNTYKYLAGSYEVRL
jgi:hypothetical protein